MRLSLILSYLGLGRKETISEPVRAVDLQELQPGAQRELDGGVQEDVGFIEVTGEVFEEIFVNDEQARLNRAYGALNPREQTEFNRSTNIDERDSLITRGETRAGIIQNLEECKTIKDGKESNVSKSLINADFVRVLDRINPGSLEFVISNLSLRDAENISWKMNDKDDNVRRALEGYIQANKHNTSLPDRRPTVEELIRKTGDIPSMQSFERAGIISAILVYATSSDSRDVIYNSFANGNPVKVEDLQTEKAKVLLDGYVRKYEGQNPHKTNG